MAGSQTITAVVAADAKPFHRGMKSAAKSTSVLTKGLKGMGAVGAAAFLAIAAGAVTFLTHAIKAGAESQRITKGLSLAVKNSKAFGSTSRNIDAVTKSLDESSTALAELVGIDDEVINGIKRNWLSVSNISRMGVDKINKLAQVAADAAAGTGKDFETVANAFTKAYGDPKNAIGKLQRAGIVLNKQEKERYQLLINQGKEAEALSFLTDTIGKKFEGAGKAAADPFTRLSIVWNNFQESVGETFLPIIEQYLPQIQDKLKTLEADPTFRRNLELLAGSISQFIPVITDFTANSLPVIIETLRIVNDILAGFPGTKKGLEERKNLASQAGMFAPFEFLGNLFDRDYVQRKEYEKTQEKGQAIQEEFNKNIKKQMEASMNKPPVTNVTINASSVDTSANTGKAIANALNNYVRQGGKVYTSGGARLS